MLLSLHLLLLHLCFSESKMVSRVAITFGLLTFVTICMIIGALIQLAVIPTMEDADGSEFSIRRRLDTQLEAISIQEDDEAASILRIGHVKPEVISWAPRVILFHNFLSSEECDYLRELAKDRLNTSTVVDSASGKVIKSNFRTSSGMFLTFKERNYPIIQAIEERISVYSQIPIENGENLQVLRYEKDQFYRPHHDYFSRSLFTKFGGQRVATMLMYLSDNVEGGETYFPMAGAGKCSCGGKPVTGVCVKPNKGDATLFWSMGLDGESDPKSVHAGCEVLTGEKWSATKWMRQRKIF